MAIEIRYFCDRCTREVANRADTIQGPLIPVTVGVVLLRNVCADCATMIRHILERDHSKIRDHEYTESCADCREARR